MIYTFYSFKGGVGRSMALANMAELLYQRGLKVLMIDFDLEAPGLERYFDIAEALHSPADVLKRRGVIDMLISYKKIYALYRLTNRKNLRESRESSEPEEPFPFPVEPFHRFVTPIYPEKIIMPFSGTTGASLSLLSAGKRDADAFTDYAEQMRLFDWNDFYTNYEGEKFFEWLRRQAEAVADVVLIDSRTGVSEMSGVCTHQLADVVVMFVAPNYQNLAGTELIARSLSNPDLIDKGRHGRPLSLLFVPSRVDPGDRDLFDQFADHFRELSNKFLHASLVFRQDPFLDLKIPYETYYSYMENVAVRTRQRASAADLIEAFENIAGTLARLAPSNSVIHQSYDLSLIRTTSAFTAPKPPKQFVPRPQEFEALLKLLLQDTQHTVAVTTALQGGGGFGKTTLAQAVCHDERVIAAFPDGILWVRLGQEPNLVELINHQIKLLARTEQTSSDINIASAQFKQLLADKQMLLVLDDVWQESHAAPFVQDSPTCAYLITTRQQEIARWLQAQTVTVNEMKTSQAVDLLIKWLAGTKAVEGLATNEELMKQLHQLAEYLGEWPLLLKLVAAKLRDFVHIRKKPLSQAIQDVKERLKRRGFTAFDRQAEKERNWAISISLGVSLDELDVGGKEALGENERESWRQRYLELAIFRQDIDIPFVTIFNLWAQTASFDDLDSEDALFAMQNLSLFTHYDADAQTVRLHPVIRAYLAEQVHDLPLLHAQFLDAYECDWHDFPPDEPYLWHHLTYHLHEARRLDELRALLFDFKWLQAKLNATDINGLLADYEWLAEDDKEVARVQRTLRQAAYILAKDKSQLAEQLKRVTISPCHQDDGTTQIANSTNH